MSFPGRPIQRAEYRSRDISSKLRAIYFNTKLYAVAGS